MPSQIRHGTRLRRRSGATHRGNPLIADKIRGGAAARCDTGCRAGQGPLRLRQGRIVTPSPPTTGGSGNVAESARAVLVTRRDGTTVHVSDGFCRLMGLSRDEMVGRSASAFGLADRTREKWVLERLPAPGQAYRYVREIGTAHGPLLASIELHAMTLGEEELIVATMAPATTPETTSDADVLSLVLDRAPVGVVVLRQRLTHRAREHARRADGADHAVAHRDAVG